MDSNVKEKIIERMEAKNLSIAELERRAGLSIHSVRNILKGRIKKPSAQSLHAIAEALECSIVDLMKNSQPGEDSSHRMGNKYNKGPFLECPELMQDCTSKVLRILSNLESKVAVDEYLDIVKKVYYYSSKTEPRKIDVKFAEWLIESQLGPQKQTT